jgi:uncharacterized Zn finger protein
MSALLSHRVIKLLCGDAFYIRGEAYYRDGKVMIESSNSELSSFTATVLGNKRYEVAITIDKSGDVDAECSCLAFSMWPRRF